MLFDGDHRLQYLIKYMYVDIYDTMYCFVMDDISFRYGQYIVSPETIYYLVPDDILYVMR